MENTCIEKKKTFREGKTSLPSLHLFKSKKITLASFGGTGAIAIASIIPESFL